MKRVCILLFCFAFGRIHTNGQPIRQRINFNSDWTFRLGDYPGAEQPKYDDRQWDRIGLPHSFSTPYFLSPQFYTGYGWYRKHFKLDPPVTGRHWSLEFEAAFQDAEVFINGRFVGRHQGGYTGFSLDITNALKPGDNVVAVRLNNLWNPRLAPRAGEHVFSGGIYRDVYLVSTAAVHITWCGSFVTTPQVSASAATVSVQTQVTNEADSAAIIEARTAICDAQGNAVARFIQRQRLLPGDTGTIDQSGPLKTRPHLWSPDHPYRYRAITSLYIKKRKIDEYTTAFGIRSIRWTADSGFFLNGQHLYLRGTNEHQDHAGWGDAVTNAGFYRDVRLMKEAGFNFIRGSHYPHDPAFYDACDSLGMLCWSENTFWGIGGSDNTPEGYWNSSAYPTIASDQAPFEGSVKQELREMILIYRNHPSVIIWSMSNEPFFTAWSTIQKTRNLLKTLIKLAHTCDPTRPAAIGGAQRPLDSNRIDLLGDVAGYNGDGGAIPLFHNPGIPNVVTEYGGTACKRPGNYAPDWGVLAADSGRPVYPWRAGQAIWCGFDHGSIAGAQLGTMGLVDYFRIPKRGWYWYRNHYRHISPPAWPRPGVATGLRISSDKRNAATDGTDDIQLFVRVVDAQGTPISNSPPVDLSIVSGPGQFPTGRTIHFAPDSDIPILDGQAAIECRAWYAGRCRVKASSPGLQPAWIELNFQGPEQYKAGVTTPMTSHPYVRFTGRQPDTLTRTFGRNNPTFASSAAPGHSSGLAADGDTNTYWQPLLEDTAVWWKLDMEKRVKVERIDIGFGTTNAVPYTVELGVDGHWTTVDARTSRESNTTIPVPGLAAKEIRITFSKTAGTRLAEIKVTGKILAVNE